MINTIVLAFLLVMSSVDCENEHTVEQQGSRWEHVLRSVRSETSAIADVVNLPIQVTSAPIVTRAKKNLSLMDDDWLQLNVTVGRPSGRLLVRSPEGSEAENKSSALGTPSSVEIRIETPDLSVRNDSETVAIASSHMTDYTEYTDDVVSDDSVDPEASGDTTPLKLVDDECSRQFAVDGDDFRLAVQLPVRRRVDDYYSRVVRYEERVMPLRCLISGAECYYPGMRIEDASSLHCALDQCWCTDDQKIQCNSTCASAPSPACIVEPPSGTHCCPTFHCPDSGLSTIITRMSPSALSGFFAYSSLTAVELNNSTAFLCRSNRRYSSTPCLTQRVSANEPIDLGNNLESIDDETDSCTAHLCRAHGKNQGHTEDFLRGRGCLPCCAYSLWTGSIGMRDVHGISLQGDEEIVEVTTSTCIRDAT